LFKSDTPQLRLGCTNARHVLPSKTTSFPKYGLCPFSIPPIGQTAELRHSKLAFKFTCVGATEPKSSGIAIGYNLFISMLRQFRIGCGADLNPLGELATSSDLRSSNATDVGLCHCHRHSVYTRRREETPPFPHLSAAVLPRRRPRRHVSYGCLPKAIPYSRGQGNCWLAPQEPGHSDSCISRSNELLEFHGKTSFHCLPATSVRISFRHEFRNSNAVP
jgi:hypothetical protein